MGESAAAQREAWQRCKRSMARPVQVRHLCGLQRLQHGRAALRLQQRRLVAFNHNRGFGCRAAGAASMSALQCAGGQLWPGFGLLTNRHAPVAVPIAAEPEKCGWSLVRAGGEEGGRHELGTASGTCTEHAPSVPALTRTAPACAKWAPGTCTSAAGLQVEQGGRARRCRASRQAAGACSWVCRSMAQRCSVPGSSRTNTLSPVVYGVPCSAASWSGYSKAGSGKKVVAAAASAAPCLNEPQQGDALAPTCLRVHPRVAVHAVQVQVGGLWQPAGEREREREFSKRVPLARRPPRSLSHPPVFDTQLAYPPQLFLLGTTRLSWFMSGVSSTGASANSPFVSPT